MELTMLKSKLHRATVQEADLHYIGSITIDEALMEAANLMEYEKVQIADIDNGNRFETYVIAGKRNSGQICLNGAAARCVQVGDKIIVMAYVQMTPQEAKQHKPKVVFLKDGNTIAKVVHYEKHGRFSDALE